MGHRIKVIEQPSRKELEHDVNEFLTEMDAEGHDLVDLRLGSERDTDTAPMRYIATIFYNTGSSLSSALSDLAEASETIAEFADLLTAIANQKDGGR